MPNSDDVAVPDEDRGFAIFDRLADQARGAGDDEQLVVVDIDLGQLVGDDRVFDGERVKVVTVLERPHFLGRRVSDPDPDEFGPLLCAIDSFVDIDAANARSVAVQISGDNGHRGPSRAFRADSYQQFCDKSGEVLEEADPPEAGAFAAGEHQMIEQCAIERLGRRRQPPRRPAIGIARGRIAGRMIVREDDPGAAMLGGVGDNVAQRETGSGLVAFVAREMQAPGLLVDMRDPQELTPRVAIGDAAGKEGSGRGQPVELERKFGTLIPQACNLLD
jgi:hypothetical protein